MEAVEEVLFSPKIPYDPGYYETESDGHQTDSEKRTDPKFG